MNAPLEESDPRALAGYEVLSRLGEGGSGIVYEARDATGARVALKVLHAELAESSDLRRRLAMEAEALQRVRGERIARVLAVDVAAPVPYIVMELVEGETLASMVRREPLKGAMLTGLAEGLLEALHDIHEAGIIHRDLKPSNIIFGPDGVKVVDFGVSSFEELAASTRTGVLMGTPAWLAPEQATGQSVGVAADVHNLGMVLAFAATGTHPYGQGRPDAMLFRIVHRDPTLEGIPSAILPVVEACLRKDPAHRPTLDDLAQHLAGGSSGGQATSGSTRPDSRTRIGTTTAPLASPSSRRRTRRRRLIGVAVVVGLAALSAGGWFAVQELDAQGPLEIVYRDVTEENPQLGEVALEVTSGTSTPVVLRVDPDDPEEEVRSESRWVLSEPLTVRYTPSSDQSDGYLETFDLRDLGMNALSRTGTVVVELVIEDDGASLEVRPSNGLGGWGGTAEELFFARADEAEILRLAEEAEEERRAEEAARQAERERELEAERERQERELEANRQERLAEVRALRSSCTSSTQSLWNAQFTMLYYVWDGYESARRSLITGGSFTPYQYQMAIYTLDGIMVDNYNTANSSLSGTPGGSRINPAVNRIFDTAGNLIDAWRGLMDALSVPRNAAGRYVDIYPSEHAAIDRAEDALYSATSSLGDAVRRDAAADCARQYPDP